MSAGPNEQPLCASVVEQAGFTTEGTEKHRDVENSWFHGLKPTSTFS